MLQILEKELKGKIQKVLFWRWSHQLKGTDELDHTHSPRKKSVVDLSEDSNDSKGVEVWKLKLTVFIIVFRKKNVAF